MKIELDDEQMNEAFNEVLLEEYNFYKEELKIISVLEYIHCDPALQEEITNNMITLKALEHLIELYKI